MPPNILLGGFTTSRAMSRFRKWKRVNLESPGQRSVSETDPARRELAERETNKDLCKPIQQLICDVHEGVFDPTVSEPHKLLHANRRMVSMMGRVALEHERTSKLLVWLTIVLVIMTAALIWLTIVLVLHEKHVA